MSDQRFFDLAMKVIGGQATDAERTELNAALAADQGLKAEYEKLRAEVAVAREILPLVAATQSSAGELPGYARERLQTKVRQTLGRPEPVEKKTTVWDWRWFLVLAPVAALFVLLLWPAAPTANIVQLAMLDPVGATRGGDTNDVAALKTTWPDSKPTVFSDSNQLDGWEKDWPDTRKATVVKIIYDRAAGEVRVIGRKHGSAFGRTFQVGADLGSTLQGVASYVTEQAAR